MENITNGIPADVPVDVLKQMAETSEQEFEAAMSVQPKAAIGTEQPEAPKSGATIDFDFGAAPTPSPEGGAEKEPEQPYENPWKNAGSDGPALDPAQVVGGMTIEEMLEVRFAFESMILAEIANEGDTAMFMPTEAEKQLYKAVYAPYKQVAAEKLPPWLWIVMIEAVFTGKRFMRAFKLRRVNKANEAAATAPGAEQAAPASMAAAVAKTVPFPAPPGAIKGTRTNWKIFADGTYQYCRQTDTQNAVYKAQGTHPIEKVDLTNIEQVKRVIKQNGWPKLQRAFSLSDEWLKQKGVDPDNLQISDD